MGDSLWIGCGWVGAAVLSGFAACFAAGILVELYQWVRGSRWNFSGKHVLVSGGSTGLGFAVAEMAIKGGAQVSILSLNPERSAKALDALGKNAAAFLADVKKFEQVKEAVGKAVDKFGPPDMVVTSAGLAHPAHFENLTAADVESEMALNFFGTTNVVKACLNLMGKKLTGKRFVLVSSACGLLCKLTEIFLCFVT